MLPNPIDVLRALAVLWTQHGLSRELATSLLLNAQALALATAISLALSYATLLRPMRPLAAAVSKGRFLGLAGVTLLFTLWLGGGRPLKLALLTLGTTVFFTTSMTAVVAAVPREAWDHARSLGLSNPRVAWEVVVLGTAGEAFELLRQNAAIGWMMLTMVEGISRAEGGVGALLLNQQKHFHLAEVFAIQLVILAVGIGQDCALGALRLAVCPWANLRRDHA